LSLHKITPRRIGAAPTGVRIGVFAMALLAAFAVYSSPRSGNDSAWTIAVNRETCLGLTGVIAADGLRPDEMLSPVRTMTETWLKGTQYNSVGIRRQWDDYDPMMWETGLSYEQLYDGMLNELNLSSSEAPSIVSNCQLQALLQQQAWKNNSRPTPPYYMSLDIDTWTKETAAGQYRNKFLFNFTVDANSSTGVPGGAVHYAADSLMRVDVEPREWYTPAAPWLSRDTPVKGAYYCKQVSGKTVRECFFERLWTAMTTGFLVASNVTINVTRSDLNSSTTTVPNVPTIIAYIVRRMPVRDSFCPCAGKPPDTTKACTRPPP
jgi:hypothetical protein